MTSTSKRNPNLKDAAPNKTSHNCKACSKPDDAQTMVACDDCSLWWHFNCAGVDESVANRSWKCAGCVAAASTETGTKSHKSAKSVVSVKSNASAARLRLKQLEEQKFLEDRLRAEQAQKDREFLAKKHELELEIMQEEVTGNSEKSYGVSERDDPVRNWVKAQNAQKGFKEAVGLQTSTPKGFQLEECSQIELRPHPLRCVGTMEPEPLVHSAEQENRKGDSLSPLYDPFTDSRLLQQSERNSNPLNHQQTQQQELCIVPHQHTLDTTSITRRQLAARQVVSTDLPKFSGDPMEWPMFLQAFTSTTAMCGIQPAENLARLQRCLVGIAREKVLNILTIPSAVPEIMTTLQDECGRPDQMVQCLLNRIRSAKPPNANKLTTLITFGREVRNLVTYIEAATLETHLSNPTLLTELVAKLPPCLQLQWGLYLQQIPGPTLKAFGEFISSIRTAACNVSLAIESGENINKKDKPVGFLNTHRENEIDETVEVQRFKTDAKPCLACGQVDHKIKDCNVFRGFSLEERWKLVEEKHMCERCLFPHSRWPCRTKQPCGIAGCAQLHHKLLHAYNEPTYSSRLETPRTVTTHRHDHSTTLFKIIPVKLYGKNRTLDVYAFLDDGSDITLIDESVADELELDGIRKPLCLQWTNNVTRDETNSRTVSMKISGSKGGRKHQLEEVRTVCNLNLPKQTLNYEELAKHFDHLRGLPVCSYFDVTPKILIGIDNARLKLGLNRRENDDIEPVAIKTYLGWTIFGGRRSPSDTSRSLVHVCRCTHDEVLNNQLTSFCKAEDLGIAEQTPPESEDDKRARKILRETTKRTKSGKFEMSLLWRTDYIKLPKSYSMAEKRLECLWKRLDKNPALKTKTCLKIQEYIDLGYAHKATAEELAGANSDRTWYLPIGVVQNPRKPDKLRLVWDAAAQVSGISLNSMLLKGPDLLTPLLSVLYQFREREYAISGDIRHMFHQLMIRPEDKHAQRFLWREEKNSPIEVFIMDVATFGATCSPCSAQYAKNLNAIEHQERYPEAAAAIVDSTYVDDFLASRNTVNEAVKLAQDVATVNKAAGFQIPTWQSNSCEVLERLGCRTERGFNGNTKDFSIDKTTTYERVLGIAWKTQKDVFVFHTIVHDNLQPLLQGDVIPTKREVLRIVMSIFDPIGFVSNYTIHGKILIQAIWRSGVQWDEPINQLEFEYWKKWILLIPELSRVEVPRCYFPGYEIESLNSIQLHVFVDASEEAFACVAYFRIIDRGLARCSLVAAKAKVTSLRPQSIPRNELNGALIGARLMKTIAESHRLPISERFFWTDSSVVLSWLHADPRNYRQYVGFRVGEILSTTSLTEWRWLPSKLNIADEATKWGNGPTLDPDSMWFKGPDFLLMSDNEWPTQRPPISKPLVELRKLNVHSHQTGLTPLEYENYSSYDQLVKRIAYLYHFIHRCKAKDRIETGLQTLLLSQLDYEKAEKALWRLAQYEDYREEISTLKSNTNSPPGKQKRLLKTSPLYKICPFLDDDGILRAETRIDGLYYSYNFRNPVVLSKNNHVTRLIVLRCHQRYGHANLETVLNALQRRFYIPKYRSTVKTIIKSCLWCKVYRAIPSSPKMAPLPHPRIKPYVRPFTFTGVDYFGPLLVKRGRCSVKRWICLFTCLSIRAIHLEVVHSLSADSCIQAFRRFVAKRGSPQHIYSDNGTNFRGASRELASEIKAANQKAAAIFTNAETQWHFNPPSTPHMGGVWERKVRSVKDAFKNIKPKRLLDDEELMTLMSEVEMIVNSHPLTFVPLENPNEDIITPNSFLLMSSDGTDQTRVPMESIDLRANLKTREDMLNQFWKRWIDGYLPTIARRTKWFNDVRPLCVGDLVVVVDEAVRNGWLRGRVIKTYQGVDGQVRRVDVQTDAGVLQRGAVKVALLDLDDKGKAE
ncbi:uncharacterized protein LOC129737947 [Uranotaenia lowii]|uniref:uncharacterized protein LOC129737947 n=1 Tax=Uranotaenia lowii TaxID=190385 RepID=UPI002478CC60|nr:uncharacterized protein LOC129737947 [Uranotaenia lowii]